MRSLTVVNTDAHVYLLGCVHIKHEGFTLRDCSHRGNRSIRPCDADGSVSIHVALEEKPGSAVPAGGFWLV